MSSFKLQKSKGAKSEAKGAGALALILGIVTGLVVHPIGYVLAIMGLVFLIASYSASE